MAKKDKLTRAQKREQDRINYPQKGRWFFAYWILFATIVASALVTVIILKSTDYKYTNELYDDSSTNSSNSNASTSVNSPTTPKKNIQASEFGWQYKTAIEVSSIPLINKKWVVDNKDKLFDNLNSSFNEDSIVNLNLVAKGNSVDIILTLKAGSFNPETGQPSNEPKEFTITINGFF